MISHKAAVALSLTLALLAAPASAATAEDGPKAIAGTWLADRFREHLQTIEGKEPPLNTDGAELYRANLADSRTAQPQFDRTRWCAGPGLPRIMFMPTPFEIIPNPGMVGFVYGWYRWHQTVDMSGMEFEPQLPQPMGYSVGRWEGDTLAIRTNGLASDTILDAGGLPHSDDMVLEEWLHVAPDGRLHTRFRITDPEFYSAPWEVEMTYHRLRKQRVTDDVCPDRIAAGRPAIVRAKEAR